MRHVMMIVLLMVIGVGCNGLTAVDGGDMADLEHEIAVAPEDDYKQLSNWAAEQKLLEYMKGRQGDDAGSVMCADHLNGGGARGKFTLADIVACMASGGRIDSFNFNQCGQVLRDAFLIQLKQEKPNANWKCGEFLFYPGMSFEELASAAGADADKQLRRDAAWVTTIALTLIASKLAPPVALGRILIPLCGLGVDWGCPDAPGYPGPDGPDVQPAPDGSP